MDGLGLVHLFADLLAEGKGDRDVTMIDERS